MQEIRKEVRRTLVIVPAQVKVREDVYPVYACRNCEKNGIETARENGLDSYRYLTWVLQDCTES